jgi:trimeric autotransporter adhesin
MNPSLFLLDYGLIDTVAGYGSKAYGGDGRQATLAKLSSPEGVAFDAAGNIYIADKSNHRIRVVTKVTGIITTLAGDGIQGYGGDDAHATSAKLNNPVSVALDASKNVYIADTFNHRIRKVAKSTGIITTVAGDGTAGYSGDGGLATLAKLHNPLGVAIDPSGNIFIADSANFRVRKVTKSNGIITTVAGTGTTGSSGDGGLATSALLGYLYGVATDVSGNIFIADTGNNLIRMVTISTGIITTVAGGRTSGYSGDGGQATSAQLNFPTCVSLDTSGNIFIADFYNYRIRMVTKSTGIITTVAGNGTKGYSGDKGQASSAKLFDPRSVAVSASGTIIVADSGNDRVRMFTLIPAPTASPTVFTSASPTLLIPAANSKTSSSPGKRSYVERCLTFKTISNRSAANNY